MGKHEIFKFKTQQDLQQKIIELNLPIHLSESLNSLRKTLKIKNFVIPNRLAIHPMEGCDGTLNGSPSELTMRRYERFGSAGVGILWYESTAITTDSRSNPNQLMLTEENKNDFKKIITIADSSESVIQSQDSEYSRSLKILQLNHSGRYSRPKNKFPQRMYKCNHLDEAYNQTESMGSILSDEELDQLKWNFEDTTRLAHEIGFDGIDIKTCHRYLLNESLSAFTRDNSKYGGNLYEERTALAKSIMKHISTKFSKPDFIISTRTNMYDGYAYPYGWGVKKSEELDNENYPPTPDLEEPIRFLNEIHKYGVSLVNLSLGNPYYDPSISRPYDQGKNIPDEHPLEGVGRFLQLTREIKQKIPNDMVTIGTGYSWLRQFSPYVGAHEVAHNHVDMVGFGRMAFANPTFGRQILKSNEIDKRMTCIACSKCSDLMRMGSVAGCVIRDAEIYLPYYKGKIRGF